MLGYELGCALVVEPVIASLISGRVLLAAESNEAITRIDQMIAGEHILVLAYDEGYAPFAAPTTMARADIG